MDVRVILESGSIWHKGKSYCSGDIIGNLDERIAMRMINGGMVELVRTEEVNLSDMDQDVVFQDDVPDIVFVEDDGEVDFAAYADVDDETGEITEPVVATQDELNSVNSAVSSILGSMSEPARRGRKPKR